MSELESLPGYEPLSAAGSSGARLARDVATGEVVELERVPGADAAEVDALRRQGAWAPTLGTPHLRRLRAVLEDGPDVVLVLDPAPGGSLAALLARRVSLTPGEVVTVAAPLASALAAVHGLGLAHGCVSPDTVLFTRDGMPLLDVARPTSHATADRYVDPAGGARGGADGPADVWALAAVCRAVLAAGAPAALVTAVEQGLHPDRAQRPDAATFSSLLRRSCPPAPVRLSATVDPPQADAARTTRGRHAATGRPSARPLPRPSSGQVAAAGLVLLVVAGAVGGWQWGRSAEAGPLAAPVVPSAPSSPSPSSPSSLPAPVVPAASDWPAVVDGLDAARASAFAQADASALDAVYAPGSAAAVVDRRRVQELASAGRTAHGVRHAVRSVEVLEATADSVLLRVVDELSAHEVRDAGGAVVGRGAGRGAATHVVALTRTPAGWRLVEVRPG